MFDMITDLINDFRALVLVAVQLLVSYMMILKVGLPLASIGRPEAAIPLLLGSAALFNALRTSFSLYRKHIAKF